MLSEFFNSSSVEEDINKPYQFPIKGSDSVGTITLVKDAKHIDQKASRSVLVESFIGEYEQYLSPNEIDKDLVSWRDGDKSVEKYYENYFKTELDEFSHGDLDDWVQATINEKLVGWATFKREKDPNEVYMNLLVVHPAYQKKGIGEQLVKSLMNLKMIPNLEAIHLLLRKKNRVGRIFYPRIGFVSDPEYKRDNFVDVSLLEGWTWRNPLLQKKEVVTSVQIPIKSEHVGETDFQNRNFETGDQKYAEAQYKLGLCYAQGNEVERDIKTAASYYRQAAELGHNGAQYELAWYYSSPDGGGKKGEAASWYRKAAEQGHASAQRNLGVFYSNGDGVEKDDKEAVKWFRKAAEQGDAFAQEYLGRCYENGVGISKDAPRAMEFYQLAADQGLEAAKDCVQRLQRSGVKTEKASIVNSVHTFGRRKANTLAEVMQEGRFHFPTQLTF